MTDMKNEPKEQTASPDLSNERIPREYQSIFEERLEFIQEVNDLINEGNLEAAKRAINEAFFHLDSEIGMSMHYYRHVGEDTLCMPQISLPYFEKEQALKPVFSEVREIRIKERDGDHCYDSNKLKELTIQYEDCLKKFLHTLYDIDYGSKR